MTTRNAKLSTKLKLFSTMRFKRFVKNDLFPGIIIFSVLLFLFDLSQSNFRLGYKTVQFSNGKSSQPVLQYDHEIVPSVHIKEKELNKFKDVKKSQRDMSNPKYDDITDTDILKKNKRDFNQKKTEISHKNKNVVNSDMLMYNRIPKTGSETLTLLINVLSKLNDYKHRQSTIFNKRRLNEDMQIWPPKPFVHQHYARPCGEGYLSVLLLEITWFIYLRRTKVSWKSAFKQKLLAIKSKHNVLRYNRILNSVYLHMIQNVHI
ncbi:uncharacterized protein LOC143239279 isoform X3 [Tachypleus tridentatus]|uniref:uncharacterized protein LOC143239279 isoform X3 n=1 Tax=Tachypleus tridentatus TaxID=6853 RepID=UPI003FD3C8E3